MVKLLYIISITGLCFTFSCKPRNICPEPSQDIFIFKVFKGNTFGTDVDTIIRYPYLFELGSFTLGADQSTASSQWKIWVEGKSDTLWRTGKEVSFIQHSFEISRNSTLVIEVYDHKESTCPTAKREFNIYINGMHSTLIQKGKYLGRDSYSPEPFTVEIDSIHLFNSQNGVVAWSVRGLPEACQFHMGIGVGIKSFYSQSSNQQARGCKEFGAWGLFDPEEGRLVVYYEVEDSLGVMRNDKFVGLLQN